MSKGFFHNKNVLVTGAAGFVGSTVVDALLKEGARVTGVDNFVTGFREFVNPDADFRELDLLHEALTLSTLMVGKHFVFHLAANADVRSGLLHPRKDVEQNILVTQNVLEAMRAADVKAIAFASSGSVYGDAPILPTPEDCPMPVQTSLYAASKVAAEGLLSAYALGYGIRTFLFRFVSLLGPRYSHGHVIDFYRQLVKNRGKLEVLGDGYQKKSYLHVADCVRAMFAAVSAESSEPVSIYNLGHHEWCTVRESIGAICEELGLSPEIRYGGGERGWVGDSPRILLATSRIRKLGWEPTKSVLESVKETVRYLRNNAFLVARG